MFWLLVGEERVGVGLEDSEDIEIFEVFFVRYFFGDGVT